jgi:hypothetical protein
MLIKINFAAVLLVTLTAFTTPVTAQSLPLIEYGYPEQKPRTYTNEKGQPDGYYPRLLNILFKKADMKWRATSYPAPRLMENLNTGATNFSILVKNAKLDSCCLYSSNPVWFDGLMVYWIGDKPPIKSKEDLIGKSLIVMAGYSYGGFVGFINDPQNRITSEPAETHASAFRMLEAGRADYLLNYGEPAQAEALDLRPVANLHSAEISRVHMYFVISKSYPNAENTLKRLESLYNTMQDEDKNGDYTKK